jgi:DNA replication protein DnaC
MDSTATEKILQKWKQLSGNANSSYSTTYDFNSEAYARKECADFNAAALPPKEDGFFCEKCKNKGVIGIVENQNGIWYQSTVLCECREIRRNKANIEASGLTSIKKLDTFTVKEEWQRKIKQKAETFLQQTENRCFYIGGQTGAGKTHLCSGISWELSQQGKSLKYFCWADEAKALTDYNNPQRFDRIEELRNADVLYIDDFMKPCGNGYTKSDIHLAFEIIDCRYRHGNKITIISSELTMSKYTYIDEATAGRISEMAGDFCIGISPDVKKNQRIRKTVTI